MEWENQCQWSERWIDLQSFWQWWQSWISNIVPVCSIKLSISIKTTTTTTTTIPLPGSIQWEMNWPSVILTMNIFLILQSCSSQIKTTNKWNNKTRQKTQFKQNTFSNPMKWELNSPPMLMIMKILLYLQHCYLLNVKQA